MCMSCAGTSVRRRIFEQPAGCCVNNVVGEAWQNCSTLKGLPFQAGSKRLPLTPYMQAEEIVLLLKSACCVNNTASGFPCLGCYRWEDIRELCTFSRGKWAGANTGGILE